jgi:hypothetical protein
VIARPPAGWRERAARAVARGERLDAFLPPLLLDSPISLLGYWWGTTVGFVWGGLWSQGRVERRAGLWVFADCRTGRSAAEVSASAAATSRVPRP